MLNGFRKYVFAAGCVALMAAMLLVSRSAESARVEAEAATAAAEVQAAQARLQKERACADQVALALPEALASQPRSSDASCRQWTESFVRVALLGNCRTREGIAGVEEFSEVCQYLKKIRAYCPAEEWPADANQASVRDACRLG